MNEENLHKEIEEERKQLKEDLDKKDKEVQEEIDKILSETTFCSRCSSKVADRLELSGKCLHKNCQNMICQSCWLSEEKRYCLDHSETVVGEEKDAQEKTFFKPENPIEEKPVDIISDQSEDKIESLVKNYSSFLRQRLSGWTPDWTPAGWIENAKSSISNKKDFLEITMHSGNFLFKKSKLKILVIPFYGKSSEDIDFLLSKINSQENIYYILALIGDEVSAGGLEFIDTFNKQNASLFLIEPAKHLIYMDEKPITKLFSFWVDSRKAPDNLKPILKTLVKEKVMGKDTLTVRSVAEKFSFSENDALVFLKSCKFLKHVEETDTFYFVG